MEKLTELEQKVLRAWSVVEPGLWLMRALEISKISGIPENKIKRILNRLVKNKYLEYFDRGWKKEYALTIQAGIFLRSKILNEN